MKFKRGDGGCMLAGDPNTACDVEYKSENGASFRVFTSTLGYQFLPPEFETSDIGERNNMVVDLVEGLPAAAIADITQ